MNVRKIGMLVIAITVMASCKKDQMIDDGGIVAPGNYENGYFVTNEGNFGTGNGSISFVSENGSVDNDVFASVNSFPLGDVVQSMNIFGGNAYILVNGSAKIEVASVDSMYHIATIEGLISPRYIAKVSGSKAYVTDWGIDGVQVVNLTTNTISSTIPCGAGPEGIVVSDVSPFAYVCNLGGFGLDNTVSVIDIENDVVVSTLEVGDRPNSVVVDATGAVWVLTGGFTEYDPVTWAIISETAGNLVKIVDNTIEATYTFAVGNHPEDLVINDAGTTLYYSDGSWSKAVYAFDISATELPTTALINKSFYGLGCANGYVYGTDAIDFTQQGWSFKYATNGTVVDSVQVGIIPGGYCFN
jgi:YVTN family beta-propeller protein